MVFKAGTITMESSAGKPSMPVVADKAVVIACSSNLLDTPSSTAAGVAKPLLVALVVTVPADLLVSEGEDEEEDRLGDLVLTVVVVVVVVRTFS